MPTPRADETREDFVARCIPDVLEDETAESNEQAVAICNSMWEQANEPGQEADKMALMQITQTALETARAVVNGSKMLSEIAEKKGVSPEQAANRMLDELEQELADFVKAQDYLTVWFKEWSKWAIAV